MLCIVSRSEFSVGVPMMGASLRVPEQPNHLLWKPNCTPEYSSEASAEKKSVRFPVDAPGPPDDRFIEQTRKNNRERSLKYDVYKHQSRNELSDSALVWHERSFCNHPIKLIKEAKETRGTASSCYGRRATIFTFHLPRSPLNPPPLLVGGEF